MSLLRKGALKAKCPKPLENRPRILCRQCTHNVVNCFVVTLNNFKALYIMFMIITFYCTQHLGKGRLLGK